MARDNSPIVKQSRREGYALAPKAHKVMAKNLEFQVNMAIREFVVVAFTSLSFVKSKKFAVSTAYSKNNLQN